MHRIFGLLALQGVVLVSGCGDDGGGAGATGTTSASAGGGGATSSTTTSAMGGGGAGGTGAAGSGGDAGAGGMPGGSPIAIDAGQGHTCALLSGGAVKCWGENADGQLGDGTRTGKLAPVAVQGLGGAATAIDLGATHSCAALADGTMWCWGQNIFGALGNGTVGFSTKPVKVTGLTTVAAIGAGPHYSCAVLADGTGRCWGYNFAGQLGNGTQGDTTLPAVVSGLGMAKTVSLPVSGEWPATLALIAGGTVKSWGNDSDGQLGNGAAGASNVPVDVSGLSGVVAIAAGETHACAVLGDGTAWGWGSNQGELGCSMVPSTSPQQIAASPATAVCAGYHHTCLLLVDGTARCYGRNDFGQLGDGTLMSSCAGVKVAGLSGLKALTCGHQHSCAVAQSGAVYCWGSNSSGQLGDGTTSASATPLLVAGL